MGELSKLHNIGNVVEAQLNRAGIFTEAELRQAGSEQAWLKIQQIDESACMNRLLALEGAILGMNKALIPEERRLQLREFYHQYKK